ncbi:hypothetical protein T484DRAFT_1845891 [Baffinella frigidus]|nr:hypothetical protein T484DRAFT_1845891 [Cryptophyta sp. CCMP2293]
MPSLGRAGFPVAAPLLLCEDEASCLGTPFYVMDFVRGTLHKDAHLKTLSPAQRSRVFDEMNRVFDEMNRVLAQLHSLDPSAIGLADYGKTSGFYGRQISTPNARLEPPIRLRSLDPSAIGLADHGKTSGFYVRQIST